MERRIVAHEGDSPPAGTVAKEEGRVLLPALRVAPFGARSVQVEHRRVGQHHERAARLYGPRRRTSRPATASRPWRRRLADGSNSGTVRAKIELRVRAVARPTAFGPSVLSLRSGPAAIKRSVALFGTTVSASTLMTCTGCIATASLMWLIGSPESMAVWKSRKNRLYAVSIEPRHGSDATADSRPEGLRVEQQPRDHAARCRQGGCARVVREMDVRAAHNAAQGPAPCS